MNKIFSTFLFNFTFQRQLGLTVTLGILFLALFSSLVESWQSNERVRHNLLEQGQHITENLAHQSSLALITAAADNVADAVNATMAFPGVVSVEIRDASQRILLARGNSNPAEFSAATEQTSGTQTAAVFDAESPYAWRFTAPVYSQPAAESPFTVQAAAPELLGHVSVVISKAALTQVTTDIFLTTLATSFSFALLFLFLIRFLTRRMTRPFNQLSASMGRAKAGELQVRAKLSGPRDIADMAQAFNSMMTVLEEREAALRVAAIAFEIEEGMLVTDHNQAIIRVNRAFTAITGYSAEEAIGQNPNMLSSGRQNAQLYQQMWDSLHRDHYWQGEIWNRRKNGEVYPEWRTVTAVVGADGKISNYVSAFIDITERKQAESELDRHRNHLQELVDEKTVELRRSETDAQHALFALKQQKFVLDQHAIVAITDLQGRITYVNDKFCCISGYTREELLGQNHRLLNSGYHPNGFLKKMYRAVAHGQAWHGEICNRAKDGRLYWVQTTIAPFMDDDGIQQEYIAISSDITERKHAEEAAAAASRAKSAFLANMSHEIRTPMNGVVGMVDILQETQLSGEQRRMVSTIRASSLSLLSILNDILDFSKIEAGKLTIETIPTCVREVIEGVAELLAPTAASMNIDLYLFVSPDTPAWIMSDPVRLRQILFNLLGNALKFTQDDGSGRSCKVTLRVENTRMKDGHSGLRLRIIDTGIGMSPEALTQMFQPFTQADKSTTRRFGGTGLGLSITQRLVEMLHGRIYAHSTLGLGSEFTVEFPLQEPQPERSLPVEASLAGVRVVVVTADAAYAEILPAYLRCAGAEVAVVADMEGAYQQLRELAGAGVLLLDPAVAEKPPIENRPVAAEKFRLVQLIRRSGIGINPEAVTVMVSPLLYHDLISAVSIAAGLLTAQDSVRKTDQRKRSRRIAPTVAEAETSRQLILLAEDNETNREVIQEQLRLLGYASEAAVDGREALEWWRSGRYALLLTDFHMPNMDGLQLTAAIRAEEPEGTHFPIIAVTANAMQGEAERCLEMGMDDYLSKPLRLDKLGAMMGRWLPLPQACAEVESKLAGDADPAPAAALIWDATTLFRMVGDNPALHRRLLEKFLSSAEIQVTEINAAVAANAAPVVTEVAHKLKSAARSVGAIQLGELCQALEAAVGAGNPQTLHTLAAGLDAAFRDAAKKISMEMCNNGQP